MKFEKYMLEHSEAYVTLSDKYREGNVKIATAEVPIFSHNEADIVSFSLYDHLYSGTVEL
ncbi:MAG: hypothetical protein MTP17_03135 [Candidatus Midichloria sp.]|nr:MAG: hypothetical protein MTP17_03135 [Candidatus Midichloria sp.]